MAREVVHVHCKAIRATEKALLVEYEGEEIWIPQSEIDDESEVFDADDNSEGDLVIPLWLAEKKGLA